ncbi:Protein of unknown function [Cotesia congregata]|uniref:Uncharacterized protein n=1 Tax=Cotesia congregata TaxID=51543 RepID=A0A8J2MRP3_COTCN|nr:Protein of unknown function [Cotesia congregata]
MIFIVNNKSICMRFYTSEPDVPLNSLQEPIAVGKIFCRRQIYEFIFDSCTDCRNMAAVPQGAFAVCKVQEFMERLLAKTLGNVLFSSTSSSASAKIPETSAEAHIL